MLTSHSGRHCVGATLVVGILFLFCPLRTSMADGLRIDGPKRAVLLFQSGRQVTVRLFWLNAEKVRYQINGQNYTSPAEKVRAVRIGKDVYVYDDAKRDFLPAKEHYAPLHAPVTVTNTTEQPVTFELTGYRDEDGKGVATRVSFQIGPKESLSPRVNGTPLATSELSYFLRTPFGFRGFSVPNPQPGKEFAITIRPEDIPPPVLVRTGEWRVGQGGYVTRKKQTVQTEDVDLTTRDPKTGKVIRRTRGTNIIRGESNETETAWEHSSHISASTTIENPTDRPIKVAATVVFSFERTWVPFVDYRPRLFGAAQVVPPRSVAVFRVEGEAPTPLQGAFNLSSLAAQTANVTLMSFVTRIE